MLEDKYDIPRRRLTGLIEPWAVKRLEEFGGDISKFRVAKLMPSKLRQIAIAKTEPGDDNNQDISRWSARSTSASSRSSARTIRTPIPIQAA